MAQPGLFPSMVLDDAWLQSAVSALYPQLWRMIRMPFDDLLVRRSKDRAFRNRDEGETAQWLRPQIVDMAGEIFEGNPDVRVEKRNQQVYLNYKNTLAITPKKFKPSRDGKGITFSSYETSQNKDYWRRREVDGLPMLPRLIVGYQFVDEMTDIKIWIAYPYGKKVNTFILMPNQVGAVIGIHQPSSDQIEADEDLGFKVSPKKRDGKKKGDKEIG